LNDVSLRSLHVYTYCIVYTLDSFTFCWIRWLSYKLWDYWRSCFNFH